MSLMTTPTPSSALQKARELEEVECMIESADLQSHSVECGAVTPNDDDTGFVEKIEHCDCGLWLILKMRDALRPLHAELEKVAMERDDYKEVLEDKRRLARELDVIINGEDGAAKQASLCDLLSQVKTLVSERDAALKGYRGMREQIDITKRICENIAKHEPTNALAQSIASDHDALLTSFPEIK